LWYLEAFAVEGFRQGKLSSYEVRQLLGFGSRWETIRFRSNHKAYPGYDIEDFEADMKTLEKLEGQIRDDCRLPHPL